MDEIKKIIAFVFRMKAVKVLEEGQFGDILSFKLKWFPPEEVKQIIHIAIESNLMTRIDNTLAPNFNVESIEIPVNFKPGQDIFAEPRSEEQNNKTEDVLMTIVKKIEKVATIQRKQIMSKINAVQKQMEIDIEAAALIVALDYNIDVKSLVKTVEDRIITKYETGA